MWGREMFVLRTTGTEHRRSLFLFGRQGTNVRWTKQGVSRGCQALPKRSSAVEKTEPAGPRQALADNCRYANSRQDLYLYVCFPTSTRLLGADAKDA